MQETHDVDGLASYKQHSESVHPSSQHAMLAGHTHERLSYVHVGTKPGQSCYPTIIVLIFINLSYNMNYK